MERGSGGEREVERESLCPRSRSTSLERLGPATRRYVEEKGGKKGGTGELKFGIHGETDCLPATSPNQPKEQTGEGQSLHYYHCPRLRRMGNRRQIT